MKRKNKILITISILITIVGIISGINIIVELLSQSSETGKFMIDGANFSKGINLLKIILSIVLGLIPIVISLIINGIIWLVYFLINKFKNN